MINFDLQGMNPTPVFQFTVWKLSGQVGKFQIAQVDRLDNERADSI